MGAREDILSPIGFRLQFWLGILRFRRARPARTFSVVCAVCPNSNRRGGARVANTITF
jgi:hypothetical protein